MVTAYERGPADDDFWVFAHAVSQLDDHQVRVDKQKY